MVEHHVKHQADAALCSLTGQLFKVLHRAETRVNGAVVCNVVAVVALGRREEWVEPDVVHAQLLQVIQLGGHAAQIAHAVAVGIVKGLEIALVDNAFVEISHGYSLQSLLEYCGNRLAVLDVDAGIEGHAFVAGRLGDNEYRRLRMPCRCNFIW